VVYVFTLKYVSKN